MSIDVPFLDLRSIMLRHSDGFHAALDRVLQSGWFILGNEVKRFEEAYASYCEAAHCVGVANGLDALALALRAVGVGAGDEVIVPANTYIATWLAVTHLGAVPVPVEPSESSFNLDPRLVEAAISPKTRAILPVHLYGQSADLDPLLDIAKAHGLKLVEDAAQAHGARYKGRRLGAHGDAVCWSFYPGKNLGCLGDGGAVTTNNPDVAERIAVLRNYGSRVKYHNELVGYNSRLDELQAAFLCERLPSLDADNMRRRQIARSYQERLANSGLILPFEESGNDHVWHLFVVRHPERSAFAQRLAAKGIGTVIHYPLPPHLQPAYAGLGLAEGSLPISERIHEEVLSLPIGPTMTEEDVSSVVSAVLSSVS